ncbi:MAG TPA: hypothetical protein VMX18_01075 [Candidatus Bipolaricaulota bacterium]|nr:hypothetical protein [Candidatus Bipolaricaulota bacterium]
MEKQTPKPSFGGFAVAAALISTIFLVCLFLYWQNNKLAELKNEVTASQKQIEDKLANINAGDKEAPATVEKAPEAVDLTADWTAFDDNGVEFKYPDEFFYQDPKVVSIAAKDQDFPNKCPNIDQAVEKATGYAIEKSMAPGVPTSYYWDNALGEKITIAKKPFCVYRHIEGAAGSTYVDYYYATENVGQFLIANFSVKYPNCGVYGTEGDKDYDACVYENETDKPETLKEILATFKIS